MKLIIVGLVGHDNNWTVATAQYTSHLHIKIGNAIQHVNSKQDHIGLLNSHLHLLVDLLLENIIGIDHPATGVDQRELLADPLHLTILTVACSACLLVNNSPARTCQPVEQRGFAHIWTSHYRYYISHKNSFRMLLILVQLITEAPQHIVAVSPIPLHLDKHLQEHLLLEEAFDILPGHSTDFLQCLPIMPDDNPLLGFALNNDKSLYMYHLIILLEHLHNNLH
ncbi:hypothetical protein EVA_06481 [gut metagenome]|uniref:Uncharacterized protein n=1 Tax=gut metagenome TaxID=749906 RepID=J9CYR4_9ZZZZ